MADDPRTTLAQDQARLVAALSGRAGPPPGFDPARIDLSARTLLAKRRKSVRRAFPALSNSLAESFDEHFTAFARTSPPDPAGPGADGFAFAQWLDERGLIRPQAVPEFIVARLWRGGRLGFSIRRGAGRWVVGFRVPGLGVRLFSLPR